MCAEKQIDSCQCAPSLLSQSPLQNRFRNEEQKTIFSFSETSALPYLHVRVDLLQRLRLVITEQTHCRDWMSLPVRPITADDTETKRAD